MTLVKLKYIPFRSFFLSLLLVLSYQTTIRANNLDSLKSALNPTMTESSRCAILYAIFEIHSSKNNIDSTKVYAEKLMGSCGLDDADQMHKIATAFYLLFKDKQSHFIDSLIQANAHKLEKNVDKILYYTKIAERAYLTGHSEQFNLYLDKAKQSFTNSDKNLSKAYYYNLWGYYQMNKGNFLTALKSYEVSLSFMDSLSIKYLQYSIDLGVAYNKIGEHKKAIDLFRHNINVAIDKGDDHVKNYSYYGLISSYLRTENAKACIALCHEVINQQKDEDSAELGYLYNGLGNAYLMTNKQDSAFYYFRRGLTISKEKDDTKGMHDSYVGMADYLTENKQYDKAEKYYKMAIDLESYIPDPELNQNLAYLYHARKDYKNAYLYLSKYNDSSTATDSDKQADIRLAANLLEEANTYKQKTGKEIAQREREKNNLYSILIGAVCLIVLITCMLYFIQQHKKKLAKLNRIISNRNKQLNTAIINQNESIKYLENFAAVAAHDLKAPIRTASSFATLLERSNSNFDEKGIQYLNFITSSVGQLSSMIDDLLSLSKLGTNLPEEAPVDLNVIVEKVEKLLFDMTSKSGASIVISKNLPTVSGHQTLLIQLFQNLIKNSIVHNKTENDSIITIDFTVQNPALYEIKVADNSGGIPDYILPTLFDLFSSSDKNSGNGIGLAICKKIVSYYGGDIWVAVQPGGSTFHFTLPYLKKS